MLPGLGTLSNSGTMPISGGDAGPSTATSTNNSGQSVGGINMGGGTSMSVTMIIIILIMAYLVLKK